MPKEAAGLGVSVRWGLLLGLAMSWGSGHASLVWMRFRLKVHVVVDRVFMDLGVGKEISWTAALTLICSCARNGISSTVSKFARRATKSLASFLEVQFFEGMPILVLIFSLTSTFVG